MGGWSTAMSIRKAIRAAMQTNNENRKEVTMSTWYDNIESVELSSRLESLPVGTHEVTLVSVREHQSRFGAGLGIMVEVELDGGDRRGWRIQLGGKFPEYGVREAKALFVALKSTDSVTKADADAILSDAQPCAGVRFRVHVYETAKLDKNGKPYLKIRCSPIEGQDAPLAPPPVPSAPSALSAAFPPPGWAQHPASPLHYYKGTQVVTETELRALIAVGKAA